MSLQEFYQLIYSLVNYSIAATQTADESNGLLLRVKQEKELPDSLYTVDIDSNVIYLLPANRIKQAYDYLVIQKFTDQAFTEQLFNLIDILTVPYSTIIWQAINEMLLQIGVQQNDT